MVRPGYSTFLIDHRFNSRHPNAGYLTASLLRPERALLQFCSVSRGADAAESRFFSQPVSCCRHWSFLTLANGGLPDGGVIASMSVRQRVLTLLW